MIAAQGTGNMQTYYDCIECFIRQALSASRLLSSDKAKQDDIISRVIGLTSDMNFYLSPPEQGRHIHRLIREILSNDDPYREIKEQSNTFGMHMYSDIKSIIEQSDDPLETAVRYAIAGNIIDMGVNSSFDESMICQTFDEAADKPLDKECLEHMKEAVQEAEKILYLGDNAGEIVFDRLLIELLPTEKITFAVRGKPIINDATLADAQSVGLTDIVPVVENGSDAPGTILEDCSDEFRAYFDNADLVISKGQGNYESLNEQNRNILFMLVVKCPVIARDIGCDIGEMVVKSTSGGTSSPENNSIKRFLGLKSGVIL